jgi:hypothetical protein
VVCATPAPPIVFPEDVRVVHEHTARLQRLAQARHAQVQPWRLQPVVEALQALRGVQCPGAVTVVAEWGALRRVDHPRQLMRDWGLTPSESSRPAVHSSQGPGRTAIPPTSVVTCNGAWRSAPKAAQDISWKTPAPVVVLKESRPYEGQRLKALSYTSTCGRT